MLETKFFKAMQRLDSSLKPLGDTPADKDAVLAAEVRLPCPPGVCVEHLRVATLREPYARSPRLLLVDVSRLSAP